MADFDFDDIEEMQVSLELEDGTELECEVIYIFEWEGDDYAVLTPLDEDIEEIYFFGIEVSENGGEAEVTLLEIEDEEVLEALADAFDEILDNEQLDRFGELDDDEEDDDDDDGRWDEFIKKKLED